MGCDFELTLNGQLVRVENVAPQTTLLGFIRNRGLTGAKEGCAEGECGACAVLFVQSHRDGSRYTPVNSCLVPLPAAAGQEIITVEALATGSQLSEAQRAMAAAGGSQCGYCTPGMLLTSYALLKHQATPTEADIREGLAGNLCRCTGYNNIVKAVQQAAATLGQPVGATT